MTYTQNTGYQKPNIYQGLKIGKEMNLTPQYVCNARRRYLTDELELLDLEIAFYDDYEGDVASEYFSLCQYSELTLKRAKVEQELRTIKQVTFKKPGLTDEMIDRAREYPVGQLIDFSRGNVKAFCHDDNNPSMFHGTRTNTVQCPVCCKSFDAISILMERDGLDFKSAVTNLCNRLEEEMVNARLHIICGNCGNNEYFGYKADPKGADMGDHFEPTISIKCPNCSTIHTIYGVKLE